MSSAATVLSLIRKRVLSGRLPPAGKRQIVGGRGSGEICDCCEQAIAPWQLQFEVVCSPDDHAPVTLRMHVACFDLWTNESRAWRNSRPEEAGMTTRSFPH